MNSYDIKIFKYREREVTTMPDNNNCDIELEILKLKLEDVKQQFDILGQKFYESGSKTYLDQSDILRRQWLEITKQIYLCRNPQMKGQI